MAKKKKQAEDPDNPEWTEADFARARPAIEVAPDIVEQSLRRRGKQKAPIKKQITIRLDADVIERFRKTGAGWQTRLNDTLRDAVFDK